MRLVSVIALLALPATQAAAEWQVKPFWAITFGGETTLVDLRDAAERRHFGVGLSVVRLGDIFGVEAEVSQVPRFFESGEERVVTRSGVTTLTGSLVVALPRKATEYTLRPYAVVGGGLLRAGYDDVLGIFDPTSNFAALNVGGGLVGFLTDRVGVGWDVRYFRTLTGKEIGTGVSFRREQLSFWRANMSLTLR